MGCSEEEHRPTLRHILADAQSTRLRARVPCNCEARHGIACVRYDTVKILYNWFNRNKTALLSATSHAQEYLFSQYSKKYCTVTSIYCMASSVSDYEDTNPWCLGRPVYRVLQRDIFHHSTADSDDAARRSKR